jgi:hypothetical protein
MVKGEPSMKDAREWDDAVPVVNQDEAPVDPFGDRDDWVVGIMSKAFWKIKSVVENINLGTLTPPQVEKVSSYIFIFHQLTDVLEELPAYLNKNSADNAEYILACYRSQIDGFDTTVVTQGISTVHNIEQHRRNLVCADAEQVANRITADEQKGLMAIEEDNDDVDTKDEDEDSDTNDK